ncbi:hemerythrin domain-containing protein [Microcoleus sp. FACHB-SPT15]|uniref:hemerythrin domain-containing protein n=1 Tax=Microcoleus sp. FACHB-SPT15 TaxID=2692830 RepID=UPI0017873CDF|nr:hemerythrin domain-containing protein [Microcoleus sp. FACHB-SPT15]MBD1809266.1 hemerythrin domain-containing protein [Microcoleus sp. FACHB-SPT15]
MVATLDDTKRIAIAQKLSDMKAMQNLIISSEQKLIEGITDEEIRKRLRDFLQDDQKNMGVLDTVIVQYGVHSEPKESTQKIVEQAQQMMESSEFSLYEKASQLELLKHKQTMSGVLVHKCAQVVGADVMAAISPLNAVNFDSRAHQEQLKGILEILGTRELTGQEPDQGLWGRVQDAMAALTGVVGSAVTRSDDEMSIRDLIRMDHTKVNTLFVEVQGTNDPQKLQEYFGQIYKDLSAHAEAEEQIVYPAIRSYYADTQELYDEQAEMKQMLEEIKSMNPSNIDDFKAKVQQLMSAVLKHVQEEENDMFPKIRDNFSDEQQKQMATQFKEAKSRLQQEMAASK